MDYSPALFMANCTGVTTAAKGHSYVSTAHAGAAEAEGCNTSFFILVAEFEKTLGAH